MEETIECIRNSCIPEDELDRYMIYRLILLSFEKDVKDGAMSFDDYVEAEREAADLCSPFIRVSSISLRRYLKDTRRKEDTVEKTPKPVVIKDEDEIGTCKQCGQPFILNKRGVKSSFCSSRCRVAYYRKQPSEVAFGDSVFKLSPGRFLVYSGDEEIKRGVMCSTPLVFKSVRFII